MEQLKTPEIIVYKYRITDKSGHEKRFDLSVDKSTLDLIKPKRDKYPLWTRMKNFKCPHCTLDESVEKYCPAAVALSDVIEMHKESTSFEKVFARIEVSERTYTKYTSLQDALSSLIGVFMVTSGCPHLSKLKPMVRFHLPFATLCDTEYRVTSMYLLAQYFLYKKGESPDWNLKHLAEIYDNIKKVNLNVTKKLKALQIKDASINAVTILNCFANSMTFSIESDVFHDMEKLFEKPFMGREAE